MARHRNGIVTAPPLRGLPRRSQRMALLHAAMACLCLLILLQVLLLNVAMEAYLGGQDGVLLPATLASAVCSALALAFLGQLRE